MILLDISIVIIIFLIGFNLKNFFKDFDEKDKSILNKLFFWHFFIAIGFHFYIQNFGGDAIYYWNSTKTDSLDEILSYAQRGSAAAILQLINYIPSRLLSLSFFTGNMLFALLGYAGFVYLYRIIKHVIPDRALLSQIKLMRIPLFPWLLFLPNIHFWSSGIGKDTILFFCIALFAYSFIDMKRRFIGIAIAVGLSLLIRPHITLFLLSSFGLGYLIDGKLPGYQKALIFVVILAAFASMFSYVLNFVQLESFESGAIEEYASKKSASLNQARSGSGVDISGYPFPLKVFTFLYRPLFFDINGILAIVASFENLILLLLTIRLFMSNVWRYIKQSSYLIKGILIYFVVSTFAFSLILGNLGIMLRQKNQLFPLFLIFVIWVLYLYQNRETVNS